MLRRELRRPQACSSVGVQFRPSPANLRRFNSMILKIVNQGMTACFGYFRKLLAPHVTRSRE
jgi:hypothetical protein